MSKVIIAVDCGKSETKIVVINGGNVTRNSFPTAIGYASNGRTDLLDNIETFSCKALGDVARNIKIGSEELPIKADSNFSKDSDINRICTMYAIAKNINPGDVVCVAVGCPLSIYVEKEKRNEYGRNIVPVGEVECVISDKKIKFTIDKRIVFAEGTGPLVLHPELFTGEEFDGAIIDIGSLNMNIAGISNGNISVESAHTSSHGGRMLIAEIEKSLADGEINANSTQIRNAILRGYIKCHDEKKTELSKKIINDSITRYIDEVEAALKGSWKNYETLELYFIGGTSFLLKNYLKERFGGYARFEESFENARFSNAEGFARKLEEKLMSKSA